MLNYFFILSPYTTENSKAVFNQSFLYSISKRSINFYWIAATPLCYVILGHIPDAQLFLQPQPIHQRELQDRLSSVVPLFYKQNKHQFILLNCVHTAFLCHIRPHSRCSTISSASAHTPQRTPWPSFISRFLILWAKDELTASVGLLPHRCAMSY